MIETFEDMIELMHTYWGGDDEVHKDLDKLLELHKKEITDICKNCDNYEYYYYKNGYKDGQTDLKKEYEKEYEDLIIGLTKEEVKRIRKGVINDTLDRVISQIKKDREIGWITDEDDIESLRVSMLEQLKEQNI